MRQVTIDLHDDVYRLLELHFAIDDLRVKEGVEELLTELAMARLEGRPVMVEGKPILGRAA